jgi:hypothetical protein
MPSGLWELIGEAIRSPATAASPRLCLCRPSAPMATAMKLRHFRRSAGHVKRERQCLGVQRATERSTILLLSFFIFAAHSVIHDDSNEVTNQEDQGS